MIFIIFSIFFTIPILSPTINNTRIYIYLLIPFLDLSFIKYIIYKIKKKDFLANKFFIIIILLILIIIFFQGGALPMLKLFLMIFNLTYLCYSLEEKKKIKMLKIMFLINSVISIFQLIEVYLFNKLSINPITISKILYGANSVNYGEILSYDNPILGLFNLHLRVSGLSTEPGYLNSLLIAGFIFFNDNNFLNRKEKIIFILGILSSFSKIGLLVIICYIILKLVKSLINKIPKVFVIIALIFFMISFINLNFKKICELGNKTWYHRTIGYKVLTDLQWNEFILGIGFRKIVEKKEELSYLKYSEFYNHMPEIMIDNSGVSTILVDHGVLFFILLIALIYLKRVSTYTFCLFLIGTINVNPFTSLSFVYIYYLNLFYKGENRE